jgi:hypothetical protein
MSTRVAALRLLSFAVFASFAVGASCGQTALGIFPGVINDPGNLSLRKAILGFGTSKICEEAYKRSLPLKLHEEDPIIGRFHATNCQVAPLATGNLAVTFGGFGWVWTNLTQRMSFEASGSVEYDTDFLMDGSTMYVYFRQKSTSAAAFTIKLVEQPQATAALGGINFAAGGQNVANDLGSQIMRGEIAKGFTVIRKPGGDVEFGLGLIEKGEHPTLPYKPDANGHAVLENERCEIHQNQRDFLGPYEVAKGSKLGVTLSVDGAPGADFLVVPRYVGEPWLQTYTTQAVTTPPPATPVLDETVFSGPIWHRSLTLAPGSYYLVLDNTSTAGRSAPPGFAKDDRAALVSYSITLED